MKHLGTFDMTPIQWGLAWTVGGYIGAGCPLVDLGEVKTAHESLQRPDTITQHDCEVAAVRVSFELGVTVAFDLRTLTFYLVPLPEPLRIVHIRDYSLI